MTKIQHKLENFWSWLISQPKRLYLFAALLIIAFVILRLAHLTRLPVFCDEAIYIRWAQIANNDPTMRFVSLTDGKQPMQTWLTLPLLRLIDDPLKAGRILSNMSGLVLLILTVPAAFLFCKEKSCGYFLPLLVTFSPFLLFFDRMALAESLLTLFVFGAFTFSYLLGKYLRLDLALLAGLWIGAGMLVKSQMLMFLLFLPLGLIFTLKEDWKDWRTSLKRFIPLYLLVVIISLAMYNLQRLSPWMYRISQKNSDFILPLGEAIKDPKRIFYNLFLAWQWFWRYLTPPIFIAAVFGFVLILRQSLWRGLFLLAWVLVPAFGEAFIARFFTSRYLAFLAPFFLLAASRFLVYFWKKIERRFNWKIAGITLLVVLALPVYHIWQLHFQPENFPFTHTDEGYVSGWTAGYGVKATAEHIKSLAEGKTVVAGTEGTFGLLSQGLEMYLANTDNVEVKGYYPLPELPPKELTGAAENGKKVFFLVNNTAGDFSQENFVLWQEFPKAGGEGSLRVYEVLAKE